jgi:hypothetical protein
VRSHTAEGATRMMPAARRAQNFGSNKNVKKVTNMLKVFTLKYEERTESFNDSLMSNFLADKEILRWESHFFERKNELSSSITL